MCEFACVNTPVACDVILYSYRFLRKRNWTGICLGAFLGRLRSRSVLRQSSTRGCSVYSTGVGGKQDTNATDVNLQGSLFSKTTLAVTSSTPATGPTLLECPELFSATGGRWSARARGGELGHSAATHSDLQSQPVCPASVHLYSSPLSRRFAATFWGAAKPCRQ